MAVPLKTRALLFGLNYSDDPTCRLNGCINDVKMMADYLTKKHKIPCTVFTDDVNRQACTAMGIIQNLYEAAVQSFRDDLDFIWIHYSGHGSFVRDQNGDEADGQDECLVPVDFKTVGVIADDYIVRLFQLFNPKTRVVFMFDCCHSGTIGDVKYSWDGPARAYIENILCNVNSRVITISGCLDNQTSADAFNVLGDGKYVGAMTANLLKVLNSTPAGPKRNVFEIVVALKQKLKEGGFTQVPKLCSSYNLAKDNMFIPL